MPDRVIKLNANANTLFAVAMICATLLGGVWIYSGRTVPAPKPLPQPPSTFSAQVAEVFVGTDAERQTLIDNYLALSGVLESDIAIKDTVALGEIQARAKQAAYGTRNPFDFPDYENLLYDEAIKRGILGIDEDGDGKPDAPIAVDRQAWLEFYAEVIGGLQND